VRQVFREVFSVVVLWGLSLSRFGLDCGGASPPLWFFGFLSVGMRLRLVFKTAEIKAAEKHRRSPNQTSNEPVCDFLSRIFCQTLA
jgi:hypothetical protein